MKNNNGAGHTAAAPSFVVTGPLPEIKPRGQVPAPVSKWLVPAFAACLGAAPLAEAWAQDEVVAAENVHAGKEEGVAWMSGGIGDEARAAMRKVAAEYNVHVLFSDPQGGFLAAIPFRIRRANGEELKVGESEGPMLFLRLPPGNYRVSAEIDGAWQSRSVRVVEKGHPVSLIFIGAGDSR